MADSQIGAQQAPFEGSEKRLQLCFRPHAAVSEAPGLRRLSRDTLDKIMTLAGCDIVSKMSNDDVDAYVLSESSLFVSPLGWLVKTCGTTQLLNCIPEVLAEASKLGLDLTDVKYSRASFLFPQLQPVTYQLFDSEVALLRTMIGSALGSAGVSRVLGTGGGLQWHVFTASSVEHPQRQLSADMPADAQHPHSRTSSCSSADNCALCGAHAADTGAAEQAQHLGTLEVCMTELDEGAAAQFVRSDGFVSSAHTTKATGIQALAPRACIDDYLFEPCGYSMNGLEGKHLMTIHVTPEAGFSYASCEMHSAGVGGCQSAPTATVAAIVGIFQPQRFVVARTYVRNAQSTKAALDTSEGLDVRLAGHDETKHGHVSVPGYTRGSADCAQLADGSEVVYHCFSKAGRECASDSGASDTCLS